MEYHQLVRQSRLYVASRGTSDDDSGHWTGRQQSDSAQESRRFHGAVSSRILRASGKSIPAYVYFEVQWRASHEPRSIKHDAAWGASFSIGSTTRVGGTVRPIESRDSEINF